jgi:hypothetical protein
MLGTLTASQDLGQPDCRLHHIRTCITYTRQIFLPERRYQQAITMLMVEECLPRRVLLTTLMVEISGRHKGLYICRELFHHWTFNCLAGLFNNSLMNVMVGLKDGKAQGHFIHMKSYNGFLPW